MSEMKNIIIEHGSFYSRCGLAGEDLPKIVYHTTKTHVKDQFTETFHKLEINPAEYNVVVVKDTKIDPVVLKEEVDLLFNCFNVKDSI